MIHHPDAWSPSPVATSAAPVAAKKFDRGFKSVVGTRSESTPADAATETPETPSDQETSAHAGGVLLGTPPANVVPDYVPDYPKSGLETGADVGNVTDGATDLVPGHDVYVPVVSTFRELASAADFAASQRAGEQPAQVQRANKRHGAVFSLMQYRRHPGGGETMLTQEQIDEGLETLIEAGFDVRFADIWHGLDRYAADESGPTGELKPLHWHAALWLPGADRSVRQIADAFGLPSARVRVPRELGNGGRGRYATEDAFGDLCEYLTHEHAKAQEQGKYLYPDAAVRAHGFTFREFLSANRPAANERRAGRRGGGAGGEMRARIRALRRAVGTGEMTLDEARDEDFDAWAEDLPRLEKLAAEYDKRESHETAALVGTHWRKSLVLITGRTRNGKDVLATALAHELIRVAALGGMKWRYTKPPGKNSLEDVGRAEIVHHEDVRFRLLPDFDEALRYFDPNQAVAASGRHRNRGVPTPRAILATSSDTLVALGFTFKRRAPSDMLVEQYAASDRTPPPLDIDEFLLRVGWHVEVEKPADAGDDHAKIATGMVAKISRIREGAATRIETARDRAGQPVGRIRTSHEIEPVAVIKGVDNAARFLAASIIAERSPDVVAGMPDDDSAALTGLCEHVEKRAAEQREIEALIDAEERAEQAEIEALFGAEQAYEADMGVSVAPHMQDVPNWTMGLGLG